MKRIAFSLFVLVLVFAASFLVATIHALPELVASNFSFHGEAHHHMTRSSYFWLMLFLLVLIPSLPVLLMGLLPRAFQRFVNLPNKEIWLSPAQLDATLDYLFAVSCASGALVALFVSGIHQCILLAHLHNPPHLPESLFWGLMIAFITSLIVLMVTMARRFRRQPTS
jgi:MFS family permease